jgi:hypothetical protein
MNYVIPSRLLRAAFAIDAAASGTLAMVQILAPHATEQLFGLPVELLVATGVLLAAYAVLLIWLTPAVTVSSALVRLIVVGNLGWAAACMALVAVLPTDVTAIGVGYLLFQAVAVVAFAGAEALGLKLSVPASRTGANLAWRDTLL